jgi:hypothetical protein
MDNLHTQCEDCTLFQQDIQAIHFVFEASDLILRLTDLKTNTWRFYLLVATNLHNKNRIIASFEITWQQHWQPYIQQLLC